MPRPIRVPSSVLVALVPILVLGSAVALPAAPAPKVPKAAAKKQAEKAPPPAVDPSLFQGLEFRLVGPYRGGRVTAVTGVPGERDTFYMGSTGGGVWKTTDGGESWSNVTDGFVKTAAVGAVAVAPSDPNVVYAGMGSACLRGNISSGDGVYRSTDAGKTWEHAGLDDAGQIGAVRVDPRDPDRVFAAVLGHAFGPNEERGVFRSKDGGKSWEKVLYVSDRAGAVDLALDPTNPRIVYAAFWQVVRKPWTLESGGPGSGLWKSTDGGDHWTQLSDGLPEGPLGRIGVAVSPARPDRVWALVEAKEGGLYRSDDGGKNFRRINPDRRFRQRAWYYTHVFADPRDADTVYILNTAFYRSDDGGKSFHRIRTPHGDNHDLWISPDDPDVMIESNDGGANVTVDGGRSWSTQANQPTAEIYRVTVDDQFPYRLYGAQQDNSTLSIPSRTPGSGITREDWYPVGGGESGSIAVDPRNPNIVYAGSYGGTITRYDHSTEDLHNVMAYPQLAIGQAAKDLRYRFQWNAPIRISPHDPSVLYQAANVVLRSTDEGRSWEVISPDLTRNDPSKQGYAGGPITRDNTGVEVYDTIFALEESPVTPGLLWAGSDDGLVHLSRDGGGHWEDITPPRMPEWATVNMIELSRRDPGRAYLAVQRYRLDDFAPYLFRTDDYGKSWKLLTDGKNGIPGDRFVRVVREDPGNEKLLYVGTERGLYVSFDGGARFQPLQLNLPEVPVTDLAVKDGDLVVATQGRGFYILDDIEPLRELAAGDASAAPHLFRARDAYRFGGGFGFGGGGDAGKNPPSGVILDYLLPATEGGKSADAAKGAAGGGGKPAAASEEGGKPGAEKAEKKGEGEVEVEVKLEILDSQGKVVRSFSSTHAEERAPNPFSGETAGEGEGKKLAAKPGHNRWVWDLRYPDAHIAEGVVLWGLGRGPRVPPGAYQARLSRGDWSATTSFRVEPDPRLAIAQEEYEKQAELALQVRDRLSQTERLLEKVRAVRGQVNDLVDRLEKADEGEGVREAAEAVTGKLDTLEGELTQPRSESNQDPLNFPPQLDNQLLYLLNQVAAGNAGPSQGADDRFAELEARVEARKEELQGILDGELARFDELVRGKGVPPVIVPTAAGD